ncbi:class I SAM-dependent methyltransferase [Yeguia hominis]|uniref:SAM-dependent methyltransferase n=1 Tax=Yeguia hominis TaxID=2763662 RepID=A0A926D9D0_9FIRM|nr:class I SAM-dependent methyltransferase [Yeguia hominis]MBC8533651.1 SAM-dependent methyltransferase [Yeguia hominis]
MENTSEKRLFQLDGRLAKCAAMLRGVPLADIGTDHAYLPVYLAVRGEIPAAIAADLREGPLESAKRTIARFHVESIVTARLSDGLAAIQPQEAEDIVIAGMGGELIAQILSKAPWLKAGGKRLVLQPMTTPEALRRFLRENGFAVRREEAVAAGGKYYTVLCAEYDPAAVDTSDLYPYIGALDGAAAENRGYLKTCLHRLEARIAGLSHAGRNAEAEEQKKLAAQIAARMKGEETDDDSRCNL